MNQKIKNTLKYLFSIALTFLFLFFAFKGTDFESLGKILSEANYIWAFTLFPLLIISHLFRAWRWNYLLRPIKQGIKFRNLFSSMMVGYMLNNILPRAGELARPYALGKLEGISRSATFGTVLMERIFDILSFMIVIALIPAVYTGPLKDVFPWLEEIGIWLTVITLTFFALFTFLMIRRDIVVRILKSITRHFSTSKAQLIEYIAHSFLDGFLFLKEPKNYFTIVVLSVLTWVFYIIMMFFPFYAFEMTKQYSLGLDTALVIQAISSIGFILPTPGATGSYHYFVIQSLTKLYGVGEEVARSYATITHAIGYMGTTLVGLFFLLKDKLHLREIIKREIVPRIENER